MPERMPASYWKELRECHRKLHKGTPDKVGGWWRAQAGHVWYASDPEGARLVYRWRGVSRYGRLAIGGSLDLHVIPRQLIPFADNLQAPLLRRYVYEISPVNNSVRAADMPNDTTYSVGPQPHHESPHGSAAEPAIEGHITLLGLMQAGAASP